MNHKVFITSNINHCGVCASPDIIHLGHPSLDKLTLMVPHLSHLMSLNCEARQLGKHVRVSFQSNDNKRSMSPFDIIHSDVWGPSHVSSILGYIYYLILLIISQDAPGSLY